MSYQNKQHENEIVEEDDFVQVDQPEGDVPDNENEKDNFNNVNSPFDCSSLDTLDGTIGEAKHSPQNEIDWKMVALETKIQILEGKLENQELKAKICALTEENESLKLKKVKQTVKNKQNAEMKELKMAFLESQRKVEEFNWKLNEMEGKLKNCVVGKQRKSSKSPAWEQHVFAEHGIIISGNFCRKFHFPGTILSYSEFRETSIGGKYLIGLSDGTFSPSLIGFRKNSYSIRHGWNSFCHLSGDKRHFEEWPNGAIKPKWNNGGDVIGCGLLMGMKNKLAIFFTLNGILLGKQIRIKPSVEHLFPTVTMQNASLEANFGDKPFEYDLEKCPGLIFGCNLI